MRRSGRSTPCCRRPCDSTASDQSARMHLQGETMSLITRLGAKTRPVFQLAVMSAVLASPAAAFPQATGSGGTVSGVRARCSNCSAPDTTRYRHEKLMMKLDSLRWVLEHDRLSEADRQKLA